ncbi:MAG TPA: OmpW family outer membrane protein [Ramlibacter sp.]|nr:OmpW family outer membrane protein [Ramlibacter sp.]
MKRFPHATALLGSLLLLPVMAAAQTRSPWWIHVGPDHVQFHTKADVRLAGASVSGANVEASSNTTLGVEIGYDLSPNLSARVTVGVPPTTKLTGTGPLAPAGELGRVNYGPAVASLTWAFGAAGSVRPYLGAGINYTIVLKSRDGAITSLDVRSAFGGVLQAGLEVPIDRNWGVFLDLKKIYLKTTACGFAGGAPAHASVRLDPLLVHAGLSYRF